MVSQPGLSEVGRWPWGIASQIGVPRKPCPLGITPALLIPSKKPLSSATQSYRQGGFHSLPKEPECPSQSGTQEEEAGPKAVAAGPAVTSKTGNGVAAHGEARTSPLCRGWTDLRPCHQRL